MSESRAAQRPLTAIYYYSRATQAKSAQGDVGVCGHRGPGLANKPRRHRPLELPYIVKLSIIVNLSSLNKCTNQRNIFTLMG